MERNARFVSKGAINNGRMELRAPDELKQKNEGEQFPGKQLIRLKKITKERERLEIL